MNNLSNSSDLDPLLAHSDWLRRLAYGILRDADAAEDVLQETLLAAVKHGPGKIRPQGQAGLEKEAGLRAWLATVASNFARRRRRSSALRRHHEQLAAASADSRHDAESEIRQLETQRQLTALLLELREPYRSAVVLRYQKELSYAALAKQLDINTATARKRVSRGVAILRREMEKRTPDQRRAWCGNLLLYAGSSVNRPLGTISIGGIALSTKLTWVAAAAAITLLAGWVAIRSDASKPMDVDTKTEFAEVSGEQIHSRRLSSTSERSTVATASLEDEGKPKAPPEFTNEPPRLSGRVVDAKQNPIEAATIRVLRDDVRQYSRRQGEINGQQQTTATIQTESDGAFSVELAKGVPFDLEVAAEGWATSRYVSAYAGEFIEVQLEAPAGFRGRVTRKDGSGVALAHIKAKRRIDDTFVFDGLTDKQGNFQFQDLQAGPIFVQVNPNEEVTLFRVELDLVAGQTLQRDFTVETGTKVTGRVLDARTLTPIKGATVAQGIAEYKTTKTDRDGRYQMSGFEANVSSHITAHAPGYAQSMVRFSCMGNDAAGIDLTLRRTTSAEGRLVDHAGNPVNNAYVACISSFVDWQIARTKADGHFQVDDLQPGTPHCLFVIAEGSGTSVFELPRPPLSQGVYTLGEILLPPPALLSGRLLNTAGEPLANMLIHLQIVCDERFQLSGPVEKEIGKELVGIRSGKTDRLGSFSFGSLAPGTYRVAMGSHRHSATRSDPIQINTGQAMAGVEITLDAGLRIEGVVIGELGEPVANAVVDIFPEAPTSGSVVQIVTGPNGSFRAEGFALGTYKIAVHMLPSGELGKPRYVDELILKGVDPFAGALRIVLPNL